MSFDLSKIKKYNLCLGCGVCQSFTKDIQMFVNQDGFIVPNKETIENLNEANFINKVCPAINIDCVKRADTVFGKVTSAYEGWATDSEIRYHASSGGIITALCCYLLDTKKVDGIIQVKASVTNPMQNDVVISTSKETILASSSSRYSPVSMFKSIKQMIEKNNSTYAFIGKPCDIMTIQRIIKEIPEWEKRIKYKISLVCAGIPSFNATEYLVNRGKQGKDIQLYSLKYRGDGWPGKFKAVYSDNTEFQLHYNESWGEVLGRNLNFRCKICPDGVGQYADIVVGDYWNTKDGYPDFSERDGKCFIISRNTVGDSLLSEAKKNGVIYYHEIEVKSITAIQKYQSQRLEFAAYRLIGAQICTEHLLKISNLKFKINTLLRGVKVVFGTIKRFK